MCSRFCALGTHGMSVVSEKFIMASTLWAPSPCELTTAVLVFFRAKQRLCSGNALALGYVEYGFCYLVCPIVSYSFVHFVENVYHLAASACIFYTVLVWS